MKNNISMVDTAFRILGESQGEINFFDLFNQVTDYLEYTEEEKENKQSLFYTNITLDGRFITVGENSWDLRSRHKFDKVHIDMNDIYANDEDEDEIDDIEDTDADSMIEDDYND